MKQKNLLSFLGIIACLLLAVPMSRADAWKDACVSGPLFNPDGKTVYFSLCVRSSDDKTASIDINKTVETGDISFERLDKTSYIYYKEWDGDAWGKEVPILYYGSFNRAGIHDGINPYVCWDAKKEVAGFEKKEGWMAITRPAGSWATVGTFEVTNSVLSRYYETVEWGWNKLPTMYSRANNFDQHCLNYDTYKEKDAYNTDFYIGINWRLPSSLAGKKIMVGFHRAMYGNGKSAQYIFVDGIMKKNPDYREDGVSFIISKSFDKLQFTRIVESSDLKVSFTPSPSTYNGIKQVYMYCNTPDTKIYYTLDGSTPTTSSTAYNMYVNGPLLISQTTTIKAIVVYNNDIKSSVQTATYTINPIEYVDLGLPSGTIWATKNVGASKEEEYGDYFAWGEIEPKDTYTKDNYKWGLPTEFTKYQNDDRYELEVQDDAASMNWGAQWHMPTKAQFEELGTYCNLTFIKINGVSGCLYTSKKDNTKSIFLPGAGEKSVQTINWGVYYKTKEVSKTLIGSTWELHIIDDYDGVIQEWWSTYWRYEGLAVRPVMNPNQPVTEYLWISGKADKTKYQVGDKFDVTGLEVNYLPKESSAEKITDDITWTVEPAIIYCGCTSVTITASYKGLTTEPFKVTITNDGMPVDLGLSVQWSSFNLGSTSFMGEGGYYAWNTNMNNDIAAAFGSGWRLPTEEEVKELQDTTKCTWQWFPAGNIENAGVAGYRVTGKSTGNFIFLPAAGCQPGSHMIGKGSTGNYWTSTTSDSNTCYMCFDMYDQCIGTDIPANGKTIRAVKK